jgi:hypothetical protein
MGFSQLDPADPLKSMFPGQLPGTAYRQGQPRSVSTAPKLGGHQEDLVTQGLERGVCNSDGRHSRLNQLIRL